MDIQICTSCGEEQSKVAYRHLPTRPLVPNRCASCGASRRENMVVAALAPGEKPDLSPICTACGTSRRRDRLIHLALARKLGCTSLGEAAAEAAGLGRHSLALKLATAAFHYEEDPVQARSLRLHALVAIDEGEVAELEGLNWLKVESTPAFVGSLVGDILLRRGKAEEALEAMTIGLQRDPEDRYLRVERAEVLEELHCYEDATREAAACMDGDDAITARALELMERVADHFYALGGWEDIREIFRMAAPSSHRSAELCFLQAAAEQRRERFSEARRWLLRALQLDPEHDEAALALSELEQQMGLARTSVR